MNRKSMEASRALTYTLYEISCGEIIASLVRASQQLNDILSGFVGSHQIVIA